MRLRPLGKTGLALTPLGYGAFKIGRNEKIKYAIAYPLPDEREVSRLLNGILDAGVNYIDTAPAYGLSEERIGAALAPRQSEFVLSTKVGETFENGESTYDFSTSAVHSSIERSLKRLRRDTLDLVFIHSNGNDNYVLNDTDVVASLVELKQQGQIRAIGFSGKTIEGARAALAWADAIMVEYHLEDRSHEPVIEEAAAKGVGVIVKKGLASGKLPADQAIQFVLSNPGVTSLIVGGLNLDHFQANVRAAE